MGVAVGGMTGVTVRMRGASGVVAPARSGLPPEEPEALLPEPVQAVSARPPISWASANAAGLRSKTPIAGYSGIVIAMVSDARRVRC